MAERLDRALAVQGRNYHNPRFNTLIVFPVTRALGMPLPLAIAFTGMIANGALKAFPNLRVGFLDGGSAQVALVIDRLRREMEYGGLNIPKDQGECFHDGRLFVRREGNEQSLVYSIWRIGCLPLVFASDFPHEMSMDNCMEETNEILEHADLQEYHKMAILRNNTRRSYKHGMGL